MNKSKVYYTKVITPDSALKMFKVLNKNLTGNVAIKVHSGENGNQNYLKPEFLKPLIDYANGTVVECNTAYDGERNSTEKHIKLINNHGWNNYYNVDIMDSQDDDYIVTIDNGKVIKENHLGSHIKNYDSMLVISHFKGHPMGGYGGALKQLSIGCASSRGKSYIHTAGKTLDQTKLWDNVAEQNSFLESMADAASSVVKMFNNNITFVSIMCNLSVDCDCCSVAEDPCMKDIGILSSLDPVALDKACIDLIYNSNDVGKKHFLERVESRNGTHIIDTAYELGIGNIEYELIDVDKENI